MVGWMLTFDLAAEALDVGVIEVVGQLWITQLLAGETEVGRGLGLGLVLEWRAAKIAGGDCHDDGDRKRNLVEEEEPSYSKRQFSFLRKMEKRF